MDVSKFGNGLAVITPKIFGDDRGYFFESFNQDAFNELVEKTTFVQDNQSKSSYGVIRGLHFQKPPYAQAKLVRVVNGAVVDFAVDIRKGSPTYGEWFGVYLSEENQKQFYIPQGFAHGFISLRDNTIFQYKCDNVYNKESEGSIDFFSNFNNGPIDCSAWISAKDIIQSDKDAIAPLFKELDSSFEYGGENKTIDEQ